MICSDVLMKFLLKIGKLKSLAMKKRSKSRPKLKLIKRKKTEKRRLKMTNILRSKNASKNTR